MKGDVPRQRHSLGGVSLPDPVPGLVIRYSCLWMTEYGRGQEEGVKDRPCAVILVSVDNGATER